MKSENVQWRLESVPANSIEVVDRHLVRTAAECRREMEAADRRLRRVCRKAEAAQILLQRPFAGLKV